MSSKDGDGGDDKTSRGRMEQQTENKLFKLMGQPHGDTDPRVAEIVTWDRTQETREQVGAGINEEGRKSPKKKIFGMALPDFLSSASLHNPPVADAQAPSMPPKAAQILGTHDAHRTGKMTPTPFLEASKALLNASRTALGTKGSRKNPSASDSTLPPTPPQKDTPPHLAFRAELEAPNSLDEQSDIPTFLKPIQETDDGQKYESPTKFHPYTAADYAKLVSYPSISSACGQIDVTLEKSDGNEGHDDENGADHDDSGTGNGPGRLCITPVQEYPTWWKKRSLVGLPPTFYSPSNRSIKMFEDGRPSRNVSPNISFASFRSPLNTGKGGNHLSFVDKHPKTALQ